MSLYNILFEPFLEYGFMKRALVASIALAISGAPLGVFLVLRRMTLVGDAMSHAILPGVSISFLIFGLSLWPMTIGGLIAGLIIALLAGVVTKVTELKEDASFTAIYLISIALGVIIISFKGDAEELMHVLFGNILEVDNDSLIMIVSISSISLLVLSVIYRSLVMECFDPGFMKSVKGKGNLVYQIFLVILVLNLVASFKVMGTLLSLGIIVLPAITARLWLRNIDHIIIHAVALSCISSIAGLLISYHTKLQASAMIVLIAGFIYIISVVFRVIYNYFPKSHYVN